MFVFVCVGWFKVLSPVLSCPLLSVLYTAVLSSLVLSCPVCPVLSCTVQYCPNTAVCSPWMYLISVLHSEVSNQQEGWLPQTDRASAFVLKVMPHDASTEGRGGRSCEKKTVLLSIVWFSGVKRGQNLAISAPSCLVRQTDRQTDRQWYVTVLSSNEVDPLK